MRKVVKYPLGWDPFSLRIYGDPHIDSPTHARDLFLSDLEKGKEEGSSGVIVGDTWSLILPRDLKRYTEGRHGDQVDAIINKKIDEAYELLRPFANHIDVMMLGNHETAVIKNHHVDPLLMLIDRLNQVKTDGFNRDSEGVPRIAHGGYTMWLLLQFNKRRRHWTATNSIWLHHGAGTQAAVTKGMIDFNRIAKARYADVYAIGHKHNSIDDQSRFEWIDGRGNVRVAKQDFMVVGGYEGQYIYGDDPEADGYTLDYSEESHYSLEAQGSKRIVFTPTSTMRAGNDYPHVSRKIERESD